MTELTITEQYTELIKKYKTGVFMFVPWDIPVYCSNCKKEFQEGHAVKFDNTILSHVNCEHPKYEATYTECYRCNRFFIVPSLPFTCPGCYSDTVAYTHPVIYGEENAIEQ